ncbi:MAG: AI-2E family transporter [Theionarchaea archaeon]|nr:AI-2E family transporter [Theionarchaea archaeon]
MNSRFFQIGSLVAFCLLLVLGFYITYYFLDILLIAVVLSYLVRPVKEKMNLKNETISTFLAEILVLVPLALLFAFTFISLVNALAAQHALRDVFLGLESIQNTFTQYIGRILDVLGLGGTQIAEESLNLITEKIESLTQDITEIVISSVFGIPYWVARLFLAAFISFYLVRDGKGIRDGLIKIVPESTRSRVIRLINACDAVVYGVVVGYLFKAILTGVISVIVFSILGIGNPVVMGVVIAVFDFIPLIGPWTIFVGLFFWYALQGEITYAIEVSAICYVTISLIPELYVRPKVAGTISHVHPMVMLIGILGGIMSLGPIGVVAGPLILGVIVAIIKSYFLDMEIERDDIIDKVIFGFRSRIFHLRNRGNTTQGEEPGNPEESKEDMMTQKMKKTQEESYE